MRRAWAYITAIIIFGLMVWNILSGESLLGGSVVPASTVIIALTLTWWFEEAGRRAK